MLKHLSIKIIQAFFFLFAIGFLINLKISAAAVDIGYEFDLNLKAGPGSIGKLIVDINNQDEDKIIDRYEITIPISNVENISVSLSENIENNFSIKDLNGYKEVSIIFESPIMPKQEKILIIQFTSPALLRSSYGLNQLYIQNPFENLTKNIKYKIEYPKSFGNIYRSFDTQNIAEKDSLTNILEVQSNNGIYVLWADKIRINLDNKVEVKNTDNALNSFLYNLPVSTNKQKVYFNELRNINEAFSDKFSVFGDVALDPNTTKEIGYSADIIIQDTTNLTSQWPEKYNYEFNPLNEFGREVIDATQIATTNYEKFEIFNQILRNNASPNKQSSIYSNDFGEIWSKFDKNATLNSFEYSALSVSFAEYLGLKARLEYGYIILSPIEMDLTRPQVWAVIDIDGNEVFSDQFMEDVSNISYFDINYIDRVNFGVWHPTQSYNPALGLAYDGTSIKVELNSLEEKTYKETFDLNLIYPESTPSGNFYNAEMKINNKSDRALIFEYLLINDIDILNNIKSPNGLFPVILPNQEKNIMLENLRQGNIFTNFKESIKTQIKFKGDGLIQKENTVNFYIDPRNVVLFAAIFAFIFSVLGFIYLRIRKAFH